MESAAKPIETPTTLTTLLATADDYRTQLTLAKQENIGLQANITECNQFIKLQMERVQEVQQQLHAAKRQLECAYQLQSDYATNVRHMQQTSLKADELIGQIMNTPKFRALAYGGSKHALMAQVLSTFESHINIPEAKNDFIIEILNHLCQIEDEITVMISRSDLADLADGIAASAMDLSQFANEFATEITHKYRGVPADKSKCVVKQEIPANDSTAAASAISATPAIPVTSAVPNAQSVTASPARKEVSDHMMLLRLALLNEHILTSDVNRFIGFDSTGPSFAIMYRGEVCFYYHSNDSRLTLFMCDPPKPFIRCCNAHGMQWFACYKSSPICRVLCEKILRVCDHILCEHISENLSIQCNNSRLAVYSCGNTLYKFTTGHPLDPVEAGRLIKKTTPDDHVNRVEIAKEIHAVSI